MTMSNKISARSTTRSLRILSNLDDIRIAAPCSAAWDDMAPLVDDDGARARSCGSCDKNVYDLSALARQDALDLITRHEGTCCVRFYRRADGTVLTTDCPVGVRAQISAARVRAFGAMAACAGAVAAFFSVLLGATNPVSTTLVEVQTTLEPEPEPEPEPIVMGKVAMPKGFIEVKGAMTAKPAPTTTPTPRAKAQPYHREAQGN